MKKIIALLLALAMVKGTACAIIHFHTGPLEKSIF